MPTRKKKWKKHPTQWTTDETMGKLFHKDMVKHLRKIAHKDKRTERGGHTPNVPTN